MTFKGDSVTAKENGISMTFTYRIEGDIFIIPNPFGGESELSYRKEGKSIFLDGEEFTK